MRPRTSAHEPTPYRIRFGVGLGAAVLVGAAALVIGGELPATPRATVPTEAAISEPFEPVAPVPVSPTTSADPPAAPNPRAATSDADESHPSIRPLQRPASSPTDRTIVGSRP